MSTDATIEPSVQRTTHEGVLLEHEVLELLREQGLQVPCFRFFSEAEQSEPLDLGDLQDRRAVLKVVSPSITHKSDLGGVTFLERADEATVAEAASAMRGQLPPDLVASIKGFVLVEAIEHGDPGAIGTQLLLSYRSSRAFGGLITVALGGTAVETLAGAQGAPIVFRAAGATKRLPEGVLSKLRQSLLGRWICGEVRGVRGLCSWELLQSELGRWVDGIVAIAEQVRRAGNELQELELNPLAWDRKRERLLPLDALARVSHTPQVSHSALCLERLQGALAPRSVAIVGVSKGRVNVGRIILRSILDGGFDNAQLTVIGDEAIDGVVCAATISELAEPVDLLIVAVGAKAVPQVLREAMAYDKARGVLLVPGGMGETAAGRAIEQEITELVNKAGERCPAIIGNNSLGLVCRSARFDSLFIPSKKLPRHEKAREPSKVALVSQSGAFLITQLSRLDFICPELQASIGNQIHARISHFAELLLSRPELTTVGLYIEGLQPNDGARLLQQTERLVAQGRDVIIYKAGRSERGRRAAMGHTASIAGDYRAFVELMTDAGALVATGFEEFTDLIHLSATLGEKHFGGRRVGLLSNAGYEAVGMADHHEPNLELATLAPATNEKISAALASARIAELVNLSNPLDITPMADDALHEACMRALLGDPGVDLAVFGNVPLTTRVQSLPPGIDDADRYDAPDGYAARTIALSAQSNKPFIVIVDAGRLYDGLYHRLRDADVPVFRSADRAIAALGRYASHRCPIHE